MRRINQTEELSSAAEFQGFVEDLNIAAWTEIDTPPSYAQAMVYFAVRGNTADGTSRSDTLRLDFTYTTEAALATYMATAQPCVNTLVANTAIVANITYHVSAAIHLRWEA